MVTTEYDFSSITMTQYTPRTTYTYRGLNHRGFQNFQRTLARFRLMPKDTDRPDTLMKLIRHGTWLELDGILNKGETYDYVYEATTTNGYFFSHPGQVDATYASASSWAITHYIPYHLRDRGPKTPPTPSTTASNLDNLSCNNSQLTAFINAVHDSDLPRKVKQQLYLAAAIRKEHPDWDLLVMSTRAVSAAVGGVPHYVGLNWRKAEKAGFIAYEPGIDYRTAKELGVEPRSAEIRLNLDIYSREKTYVPKVDLTTFRSALDNFKGYIKYARAKKKKEQNAYLRAENRSAIVNRPESLVERRNPSTPSPSTPTPVQPVKKPLTDEKPLLSNETGAHAFNQFLGQACARGGCKVCDEDETAVKEYRDYMNKKTS